MLNVKLISIKIISLFIISSILLFTESSIVAAEENTSVATSEDTSLSASQDTNVATSEDTSLSASQDTNVATSESVSESNDIVSTPKSTLLAEANIPVSQGPYNRTVLGNSNLFVKGTSWPTNIQIAGYDTTTNTVYLDFTLTNDTRTVNDFKYVVDVFSDNTTSNTSRINANTSDGGTVDSPITLSLTSEANSGNITNKPITLNVPLTSAHRIVVTVVSAD